MPNLRNWQQGTAIIVTPIERNRIPPPVDIDSLKLNSKENDQSRNSNSAGERGGQNIGILLPPFFVVTSHIVVHTESDDQCRPRVCEVVGSPVQSAVQHNRDMDITDPGIGVALGEEIEWDGKQGTDEEAPFQWMIDSAIAVDAGWANYSPDDRCSEEGVCI